MPPARRRGPIARAEKTLADAEAEAATGRRGGAGGRERDRPGPSHHRGRRADPPGDPREARGGWRGPGWSSSGPPSTPPTSTGRPRRWDAAARLQARDEIVPDAGHRTGAAQTFGRRSGHAPGAPGPRRRDAPVGTPRGGGGPRAPVRRPRRGGSAPASPRRSSPPVHGMDRRAGRAGSPSGSGGGPGPCGRAEPPPCRASAGCGTAGSPVTALSPATGRRDGRAIALPSSGGTPMSTTVTEHSATSPAVPTRWELFRARLEEQRADCVRSAGSPWPRRPPRCRIRWR